MTPVLGNLFVMEIGVLKKLDATCLLTEISKDMHTHIYTHTHIYIYIHMYMNIWPLAILTRCPWIWDANFSALKKLAPRILWCPMLAPSMSRWRCWHRNLDDMSFWRNRSLPLAMLGGMCLKRWSVQTGQFFSTGDSITQLYGGI